MTKEELRERAVLAKGTPVTRCYGCDNKPCTCKAIIPGVPIPPDEVLKLLDEAEEQERRIGKLRSALAYYSSPAELVITRIAREALVADTLKLGPDTPRCVMCGHALEVHAGRGCYACSECTGYRPVVASALKHVVDQVITQKEMDSFMEAGREDNAKACPAGGCARFIQFDPEMTNEMREEYFAVAGKRCLECNPKGAAEDKEMRSLAYVGVTPRAGTTSPCRLHGYHLTGSECADQIAEAARMLKEMEADCCKHDGDHFCRLCNDVISGWKPETLEDHLCAQCVWVELDALRGKMKILREALTFYTTANDAVWMGDGGETGRNALAATKEKEDG